MRQCTIKGGHLRTQRVSFAQEDKKGERGEGKEIVCENRACEERALVRKGERERKGRERGEMRDESGGSRERGLREKRRERERR